MKRTLTNFSPSISASVRSAFDRRNPSEDVLFFFERLQIDPRFLEYFDIDFFVASHGNYKSFSTLLGFIAILEELIFSYNFTIGPDFRFDFKFYKSICFDQLFIDRSSAFRHFLRDGLRYNIAPNRQIFFQRLGLFFPTDVCLIDKHPPSMNGRYFPTYWHFIDYVIENDHYEEILSLPSTQIVPGILISIGKKLAGLKQDELAQRFLWRYAETKTLSSSDKQLLADISLNGGQVDASAALYASVLSDGRGNKWTRINLARSLAAMDLFTSAYEIMLQVRDQFVADEMFCRYFDQICEQQIESAKRTYRKGASEGDMTTGDAREIELACAQVDAALRRFYQHHPIPQPAFERQAIGILANGDLPQCWFYRVEQKRLYLESLGIEVHVYDVADLPRLRRDAFRLDALVIHRLAYSVVLAKAVHEFEAYGVSLCYDIDDLIFDIRHYPGPLSDWHETITREVYLDLACGTALFKSAIGLFHDIIVSTDELRDIALELFPKRRFHVFRNGIDVRFDDFAMHSAEPERLPHRFFTIIYGTGSLAQRSDWLQVAEPALRRLLTAHDHVRVIFVGPFEPREMMDRFPGRFMYYAFCQLEEYWSLLSQSDATLSVLRPMPRNAVKSELKWTEAAYFGVPAIICGGGAILRVTEHGRNTLHAVSADDVFTSLSTLVRDANLHRGLRARAYVDAVRSLGPEPQARTLAGILKDLSRTRQLDLRPVLMVVNVFFWPEMVGGATRIVKEEVDDLIDSLSHRYRIVVVCGRGLTGAFEPYVTDYAYRGACVHQICYPQYADMDWHFANEDHQRLFADIIAVERPRLIHFHAVQRLTAGVVAAAAEAGVPYVVTVHDGWWIADDMFFKDGPNIAVPVSPEVDGAPEPPASVLRRVALSHLLRLAAEVIVVSEQFRAIYAGMVGARYRVITNGSDPVPPSPRPAREPGRFVLGFIGGLSSHKGFDLVRLVFQLRAFPNLHLVIVDHAMMEGESRGETWGENRIERIGRVEQAEVGQLYARLDYLLAPSLWPESFGLVSREAALAGVYVIASDRGAMGDDLVEGVTGSRIGVDSHEPLLRLLTAIDEGRFRPTLPVPLVPVKSTRQQAEEVRACLLRHMEGRVPAALPRA